MKFFPDFALRDLFGWMLALGVLAAMAALFPWELGEKADPFVPAFKDIRPEWYFMFMFETLKLVPGGEILGIEYEAIPILLFGAAGMVLMLVPFLERRREGGSPVFTAVGIASLIYMVGMTAWGYRSLVAGLGHRRHRRWSSGILRVGTGRAKGGVMRRHVFLFCMRSRHLRRRQSEPSQTPHASPATPTRTTSTSELLAIPLRFEVGVHADVGLSCHDCHGGNPDPALAEDTDAMDPAWPDNPYTGEPRQSRHPRPLRPLPLGPNLHEAIPPGRQGRPGAGVLDQSARRSATTAATPDVATCTDCHSVHGIRRVADPEADVYPTRVAETCGRCHADAAHMAGCSDSHGRPMPMDQLARWQQSVHAASMFEKEDLTAPTCNDCHGNHGAAPPGLESVSFVCGQCHGREAELFSESSKHDSFETHNEYLEEAEGEGCAACHEIAQAEVALASFSECSTCHGNHGVVRPTIAMFSALPETPCEFCHDAGDGESPKSAQRFVAAFMALLTQAAEEGLSGQDAFDWLVDQATHVPEHSVAGESDECTALRPEFANLFGASGSVRATRLMLTPSPGKRSGYLSPAAATAIRRKASRQVPR